MQDTGPDERLTVAEAADRLSISKEAVRKRISRGTLRADRDMDGTVMVYVPATRAASDTTDALSPELVESLREQVAYLRGVIVVRDQELRERAEEIRRRDAALEREQQLAAMFAERLRELEAPRDQDERESPETAATGVQGEPTPSQEPTEGSREYAVTPTEPPDRGAPRSATPGPQEPVQRPWWRRMLGG
jgi:excisionase family DNA binding protein